MSLLDSFSPQARHVARNYDSWAARYDEDFEDFHSYVAHQKVAELVRASSTHSSPHILDLATGTGLVLEELSKTFDRATMTGLDASARMVDKALGKYLTRDIRQCDIETPPLPVADKSADIVTCAGALSMIGNLDNVLKETKRVIKDDGLSVMSYLIRIDYRDELSILSENASAIQTYPRPSQELIEAVKRNGFEPLGGMHEFCGYKSKRHSETHGVIAFIPR